MKTQHFKGSLGVLATTMVSAFLGIQGAELPTSISLMGTPATNRILDLCPTYLQFLHAHLKGQGVAKIGSLPEAPMIAIADKPGADPMNAHLVSLETSLKLRRILDKVNTPHPLLQALSQMLSLQSPDPHADPAYIGALSVGLSEGCCFKEPSDSVKIIRSQVRLIIDQDRIRLVDPNTWGSKIHIPAVAHVPKFVEPRQHYGLFVTDTPRIISNPFIEAHPTLDQSRAVARWYGELIALMATRLTIRNLEMWLEDNAVRLRRKESVHPLFLRYAQLSNQGDSIEVNRAFWAILVEGTAAQMQYIIETTYLDNVLRGQAVKDKEHARIFKEVSTQAYNELIQSFGDEATLKGDFSASPESILSQAYAYLNEVNLWLMQPKGLAALPKAKDIDEATLRFLQRMGQLTSLQFLELFQFNRFLQRAYSLYLGDHVNLANTLIDSTGSVETQLTTEVPMMRESPASDELKADLKAQAWNAAKDNELRLLYRQMMELP